ATALHRAKEALPGARRNAARFRSLLSAAQRREEAAAHSTGVAQTKLMLASQSTEKTEAMVAEQRARIGRVARAVYQRGGPIADLSLLLDSESPADFSERLVALQAVMSSQRSALSQLQEVT